MANTQHYLPKAGKLLRDIKKVVLATDDSVYGAPEIYTCVSMEAARARGVICVPGDFDYAVRRCSDVAGPCREVLQSDAGP
eukprot:15056234-Alexandrium_andersonii.AAC.1